MNEEVLENIYRENLEERTIAYLAETQNLSYETAMDLWKSIAKKTSKF